MKQKKIEKQRQPPDRTLQDVTMQRYRHPRLYKYIFREGYVSLSIDFWQSDYRLSMRGIDRVREVLRKFLPIMWQEEFYWPSMDFIGITARPDFADAVIQAINIVLDNPENVIRMPVTRDEIFRYFDMLCQSAYPGVLEKGRTCVDYPEPAESELYRCDGKADDLT